MFTFHKPKVFRSVNGCCICKAKSSSSRFTDSKKYEYVFNRCFNLDEERSGEICNACVLLVKRFLKLPKGSTRNWQHVVDARSGPGIKSLVKSKNKKIRAPPPSPSVVSSCNETESPEKIKRKHVYKRKTVVPPRKRNPSIAISDFLDMSYWTREQVCCGTIFRGPNGEVAIDARYFRPCSGGCNKKDSQTEKSENGKGEVPKSRKSSRYNNVDEEDDEDVDETEEEDEEMDDDNDEDEDIDEEDSERLSDSAAAFKLAEDCGASVDEGFFDKPAVSPSSGGSFTPPPLVLNNEDMEYESQQQQIIKATRATAASSNSET